MKLISQIVIMDDHKFHSIVSLTINLSVCAAKNILCTFPLLFGVQSSID